MPIRQIYLWFITSDYKIAIVGKNNKWQFPGGKPEKGETHIETIEREVFEEAGLILSDYKEKPEFFGYYLIENDISARWPSGKPYLHVRYIILTNKTSEVIPLSSNEREVDTDTLDDAKFVNLFELEKHILWIKGREEYKVARDIVSKFKEKT